VVADVMQNQIGRVVDHFIYRHHDIGRAQNDAPSSVAKYWLFTEYLCRATETKIALVISASD